MPVIIDPRRWRVEGPPDAGAPQAPLARRLVWFVCLAVLAAAATIAVAYLLKALLPAH